MENQPISIRTQHSQASLPSAVPIHLSEDAVRTNSAALRAFPEDDKRAVMRADSNGQLIRPTGLQWAQSYRSSHTDLGALQTTIQKTFEAVLTPCDEQLRDWDKAKAQGELFKKDEEYKGPIAKNMTSGNVEGVKETLREAHAMLSGLNRLHESLKYQYRKYADDTPEKRAISDLERTINYCTQKIAADQHILSELGIDLPLRLEVDVSDVSSRQSTSSRRSFIGTPVSASSSSGSISPTSPTSPATPKGVIGDPLRSLGDYLTYFGPEGLTATQVEGFMKEGRVLLNGILNGTITDAKAYPGGAEKALHVLTWKLQSLAIKKGQGHTHGSLAIEDPNGRLYAFLESTGTRDRLSSHYKNRRVPGQETYQKGSNVHTLPMPGNQTHILRGQLKNPELGKPPLLFFKMESSDPIGGGAKESLKHAGHYAQSLGRKAIGGNEGYGLSRENVPKEIKKAFKALLTDLNTAEKQEAMHLIHTNMEINGFAIPKDGANASDLASAYGISYMTRFLEEAKNLKAPLNKTALANFEKTLSSMHLDHLDKRTGKEVYLTEAELREQENDVGDVKMHFPPGTTF